MSIKKEQPKIKSISFDYSKLIDELNDQAYNYCVSNIYPLCNYKVLKENDIRRIDLKEYLSKIDLMLSFELKKQGDLNTFLYLLEFLLDNVLICKTDSIAEKYKKRAKISICNARDKTDNLQDVEDAFLCFIILLHAMREYLHKDKKCSIVRATLYAKRCYSDTLKTLFESDIDFSDGMIGKKKKKIVNKTEKLEEIELKKFFFINSIIFLARIIQKFGGFEGETENDG